MPAPFILHLSSFKKSPVPLQAPGFRFAAALISLAAQTIEVRGNSLGLA